MPLIPVGYAVFLLFGGAMGWKAGSRVSLIMGLISSLLVFAGSLWVNRNPSSGYLYLTVIAGALCGVFLMRLLKTKKIMPSGALLAVSLGFLIFCAMRIHG